MNIVPGTRPRVWIDAKIWQQNKKLVFTEMKTMFIFEKKIMPVFSDSNKDSAFELSFGVVALCWQLG